MADPLSQLRQFHINGKDIKEHNGYIIFGDHGWPKTVNTNYVIYSSGESGKKEYYTLECLLYFLKNVNVAHHHYVRQAGRENVPVVHRPDRKNILAYLTGEQQASPGIDKNAPIPSLRLPVAEIYKLNHHAGGDHSTNSQNRPSATQTGSADSGEAGGQKKRPHDLEVDRLREAFAARLDESTSKKPATITTTETNDSHNESTEGSAGITELGRENLAAMRAKRMAVKRTTIVDADMETAPIAGLSGVGAHADSGSAGREADLLIAMDSDPFKLIKSKEKVWRTRSSILQAQSKNFAKSVLPLAQLILKPGEVPANTNKRPSHMTLMPEDLPGADQQHQFHKDQQQKERNPTYNRYDQERFTKLDIGVEIDTKKSFVSGVVTGLPYPGAAPGSANAPVTGANTNPSTINNQAAAKQHPNHQQAPTQHFASDGRQVPSQIRPTASTKKPTKKVSRVPIIIIPATTTSIINMYNAQAILQDLNYVEGSTHKQRESDVLIQRRRPDGTCALYKVMDNPVKLEPYDWERVVAVFVQGPAWQFKGWPWKGSPVEIFARIKGFHLKWDESRLDDNVAKWNVHILELSRNKRHLDKASLLKFWSSLDAFMLKFKPELHF